jgi:hypothetical protein
MNLAMYFQHFTPAPVGGLILAFFVFIVIGVCLWLVETYVPMSQPFRVVLRVVVVLLLVYWLLRSFGLI